MSYSGRFRSLQVDLGTLHRTGTPCAVWSWLSLSACVAGACGTAATRGLEARPARLVRRTDPQLHPAGESSVGHVCVKSGNAWFESVTASCSYMAAQP